MMELFPAIDLRGGKCVRLQQGDYARETVYGDDPVAVAVSFAEAGAPWIHVVDLDAARGDAPLNRPIIRALSSAVSEFGVRVQTGGGVRDVGAAAALRESGVARVIIGTAAVRTPQLVAHIAKEWSGGAVVGLDFRHLADGRCEVAVQGWTEGSGLDLFDLVATFSDSGAAAFVVTEIGRDGMLAGPDVDGLRAVVAKTHVDVIASGGVSSLEDLMALQAVNVEGRTLAGVITGKAIYEGRFTVDEALDALGMAAEEGN
jgi:phosphoribosylformimino-5-aminoimidazole carboxamide ribotide isomerase